MARTFLFSLNLPDREIFRLRRLPLAFSPAGPSSLGSSLGSRPGGEGSLGPGCGAAEAGGCGLSLPGAPPLSLPFFLLPEVNDFHQGPELPLPGPGLLEPPLSAITAAPSQLKPGALPCSGFLQRRAKGKGRSARLGS